MLGIAADRRAPPSGASTTRSGVSPSTRAACSAAGSCAGQQLQVGMPAPAVVLAELEERPEILSVKVWRATACSPGRTWSPSASGGASRSTGGLAEVIERGEPEAHLEELRRRRGCRRSRPRRRRSPRGLCTRGGGRPGRRRLRGVCRRRAARSVSRRSESAWCGWRPRSLPRALGVPRASRPRGVGDAQAADDASCASARVALEHAYDALETNTVRGGREPERDRGGEGSLHRRALAGACSVMALAIGRRARLHARSSSDALRFGGALPRHREDRGARTTILTKPATLTGDEYEQIKTHSAEGARIIAKFSRLHAAVPIVRHHHERWDGEGYPDGLSATRSR